MATEPGKGRNASVNKQLRAAYRARFGASLALLAVISCLGFVAFSRFHSLRPYLVHAMVGLGALSVVLYCLRSKRSGSELTEHEILKFYHNPGYWSFVVIGSAAFLYGLCSTLLAEREQAKPLAVRTPKSKPLAVAAVPIVPIEFPPLHLMGLVFNGKNSSVVINGHNLHLGEMIEGVKIEEIHRDSVVVEFAEQRKTLLLGVLPDRRTTNTTKTGKATRGKVEPNH